MFLLYKSYSDDIYSIVVDDDDDSNVPGLTLDAVDTSCSHGKYLSWF